MITFTFTFLEIFFVEPLCSERSKYRRGRSCRCLLREVAETAELGGGASPFLAPHAEVVEQEERDSSTCSAVVVLL